MSTNAAMRTFGGRLGRHSALYASAAMITFVLSIVQVAVLTRILSLADFGRLALLLLFAGLLTVLYNIGTLQGTFLRVYGSTGEEDVDPDADESAVGEKRQSLGSSFVLTLLIGLIGFAFIAPLSGPIAGALIGQPRLGGAVVWAAASAAMGSLWRLVLNVMRYERRPVGFVALGAARPVLTTACTLALVLAGYGIAGAMAGVAVGTLFSVLLALSVTRRSYAFAFRLGDVYDILRRGRIYILIILSFWVLHNVDLYIISVFASDEQVALFRVASRVAAGVSYFVSAYLMAWTALTRTSLHEAVQQEQGLVEVTSNILLWFALTCLWLLLGLTVLADGLIRIAPAAYGPAAPLIPLIGLGFVAYGAFVIAYRATQFPGRRTRYARLAMSAAVIFLVLALGLVPLLGAYGAAVAQIVALAAVAALTVRAARRAGEPLRLETGRLVRALALALALLGLGLAAGRLLGDWRIVLDLISLLAFPMLLPVVGALPREDARRLLAALGGRARAPRRRMRLIDAIRQMDPRERRIAELLIRWGRTPTAVAGELGQDAESILRELVAALRRCARAGEPDPGDAALGAYLLSGEAVAERDIVARRLWNQGFKPLEMDALERIVQSIQRASARAWRQALATPAPCRAGLEFLPPGPEAELLALAPGAEGDRASDGRARGRGRL